MDDITETARTLIKKVVPSRILDSLWARYLTATSTAELTVASSLVDSPKRLEKIRRQHLPSNNERDFLTIDWLRKRVAEVDDPALKSYFAMVANDTTPALCAPSHCYQALINSVIAVSVQSNLQLGYTLKEDTVFISNYAQLLRDLHAKAAVELHLVADDRELTFFLEKWQIEDQVLVAPRSNPITRKIYLDSPSAKAFLETPGKALNELYELPLAEECTFEVDVVYTWVDSDDPEWQELLARHTEMPIDEASSSDDQSEEPDQGKVVDTDRFLCRDELKYSLRSLLKFAPWVRHVYVLTNCKPPPWFDESNERVRWVYHEEIIDAEHLPTFSSHAIEASVHLIPGLSEHFLYFNDDLFVVKPVEKSDFFLPNGIPKIRPEPYGMVHGELDPEHPDYINAARNVQALLKEAFGKTATKLHTHSPQSMRLSIVRACEATFPDAYRQTRSNRFRSITDISPTSFMYPSFAYLSGQAVMDYPNISLINVNKPYKRLLGGFSGAMNSGNHADLPLTLCINDGGGSAEDEDWGQAIIDFMDASFDEISEAERAYDSLGPQQ